MLCSVKKTSENLQYCLPFKYYIVSCCALHPYLHPRFVLFYLEVVLHWLEDIIWSGQLWSGQAKYLTGLVGSSQCPQLAVLSGFIWYLTRF